MKKNADMGQKMVVESKGQESMALRELQMRIDSTRGVEMPTKRKLLETGVPLDTYTDGDYALTAFQNGFALVVSGKRYTVVRVDRCLDYVYVHEDYTVDDAGEGQCFDAAFFLDLPWYLRVMMQADDQFWENEEHREHRWLSEHPEIPDDKDWMRGGHSSFESEVIGRMEWEEAMWCLTDKQRTAFRLYYEEGYTQEEVGEMLGITRAAVQERLIGAIKKLKKFYHDM